MIRTRSIPASTCTHMKAVHTSIFLSDDRNQPSENTWHFRYRSTRAVFCSKLSVHQATAAVYVTCKVTSEEWLRVVFPTFTTLCVPSTVVILLVVCFASETNIYLYPIRLKVDEKIIRSTKANENGNTSHFRVLFWI